MQKHLFEYAIIRIVPRVYREEFINAGVILYCKKAQYLATRFTIQPERILALDAQANIEEITEHLQAYEKIAAGATGGGPIGQLDLPSRFRWLTATRSTIIQSSKIHPGLCDDLDATLHRLHGQLVL